MTTDGPSKHILITDINKHADEKRQASSFAHEQDWSDPSCAKCYLAWLHSIQSRDSWACTGNPNQAPCISYVPPLSPHAQAQSMNALNGFVNKQVDDGRFDESLRTYQH